MVNEQKIYHDFEYGAMTTIIIIVGREKIYHDLIICIFIKIKSIY
jgi:hypothetical protein